VTDGRLAVGRKVVSLAGEPRPHLSPADRAELVRSCPHPYRATLDAIVALGYRTGRCWASLEAVMDKAGLSRRAVLYHRRWLVDHGYLTYQGGGHKGRNATFIIATPAERAARTTPPAWARIADPDLRSEALSLEL
jgi:hypothetical protein